MAALRAGLADPGGLLPELGFGPGDLGVQRFDPGGVVLQFLVPGPGLLRPDQHLVDARRVLADQLGQRGPAVLDLGEPFRALRVKGGLVAGEFGGDVVEQETDLGQACRGGAQLPVVFGNVLQGAFGGVHEGGRVGFFTEVLGDERLVGGAGRDPQFLDVGQFHGLGLEGLVLPRLRVHGVDLGQGDLQRLGLAEAFTRGTAQGVQLALAGMPVRVEVLIGGQARRQGSRRRICPGLRAAPPGS